MEKAEKTVVWESPTFPFVRYLESHFRTILAEADQLAVEDYEEWPQRDGYTGAWKVFCFFSRDPSWHFAPSCPKNALRVPETVRLIQRISGVSRAGFSMLLPGTHISAHRDGRDGDQDLLRCHMGLHTNDKSGMRVDGQTVQWDAGRCLIFDGQALHEAANLGDTPRILCMVDVDRTALEDAAPD